MSDTLTIASQQVSWWSVHTFVTPLLTSVGTWPMVGTPAWCALPDDDARIRAAVFDAAQHWALRLETCQEARADASKAVAGAVDWTALARVSAQRTAFYENRPWLKRRTT